MVSFFEYLLFIAFFLFFFFEYFFELVLPLFITKQINLIVCLVSRYVSFIFRGFFSLLFFFCVKRLRFIYFSLSFKKKKKNTLWVRNVTTLVSNLLNQQSCDKIKIKEKYLKPQMNYIFEIFFVVKQQRQIVCEIF